MLIVCMRVSNNDECQSSVLLRDALIAVEVDYQDCVFRG